MLRLMQYGLLLGAFATTAFGSALDGRNQEIVASIASFGSVEELGTAIGPASDRDGEAIAGRYQRSKRSWVVENAQPPELRVLLAEAPPAKEKRNIEARQVVTRTRPPRVTTTGITTTAAASSSTPRLSSSTTSVTPTTSAPASSTPSSSPRSSSAASSSIVTSSTPRTTTVIPTTTAPVCAPKYTGAFQVTGTGTLPKPTTFVQKNQAQLLSVNGAPFRMVGPNIYWICQDENVGPVGAPTTKERVREALAIAVAMGANTIRALSCGVSVGSQYSISPSPNVYGNWDIHDYVIYAANQYGLRVIMTLTDNYDYYHGGKYTFLRWAGASTANGGAAFYTNAAVIQNFQNYVKMLVGHYNPYTGRTWANDPTIAAWETGNELGGYIGREGYPPAAWTQGIINAIRTIDSQHLIMDGSNGFYNYSTKETAPGLGLSGIAIMSDHGYPRNIALLNSQIPLASNAQKAFFIGEYDWTDATGGDALSSYLTAIESTNYLGDMIWNVMGHDAQCCKFVPHNEAYSMYYPNGNTQALQVNILQIVQHWYRVTGRPVPATLPGASCPQPVF